MGKRNRALKHYFRQPRVAAEFYDVAVFDGEREISPEELEDVSDFYGETLWERNGQKAETERERDVVKLLHRGGLLIIAAVENQDVLNYVMPLRCLEYDLLDYRRQLRMLREKHKKAKDLRGSAEFLSGIKEGEKLTPVITILFYHGPGKWTASKQLHDLLDMEGIDEKLKGYVANYKMHVVCLCDLEEEKFETGLRELIATMKRRNSKKEMESYCRAHAERFQDMDEETYDAICMMTGWKELIISKDKHRNPEGGIIDMCKAVDDWAREEKEKGIRIGRRQGERVGKKRGEAIGEKRGEKRLLDLIVMLYRDGRDSDVKLISSNLRRRRELYQEYGI